MPQIQGDGNYILASDEVRHETKVAIRWNEGQNALCFPPDRFKGEKFSLEKNLYIFQGNNLRIPLEAHAGVEARVVKYPRVHEWHGQI